MKPAKLGGIKGRVVVTRMNEAGEEEASVYREGRLGLAYGFPARRPSRYATQPTCGIQPVHSGTRLNVNPPSQGGLR